MKARYAFLISLIIGVSIGAAIWFVQPPEQPRIEYTFQIPPYQNANCFTFTEGTLLFSDKNYHELPYVVDRFAPNGTEVTLFITYYFKESVLPLNATGTNIVIPTPKATYTKVGEMQVYTFIVSKSIDGEIKHGP